MFPITEKENKNKHQQLVKFLFAFALIKDRALTHVFIFLPLPTSLEEFSTICLSCPFLSSAMPVSPRNLSSAPPTSHIKVRHVVPEQPVISLVEKKGNGETIDVRNKRTAAVRELLMLVSRPLVSLVTELSF